MKNERPHSVSQADNGLRLDIFLARVAGYGVRTIKRLAAEGRVLVDGKPRPALFKLTAGSEVTVAAPARPLLDDPAAVPVIAARAGEYLAFVKQAGMHTAAITGNPAASLEQVVNEQWEKLHTVAAMPEASSVPASLLPFPGGPLPAAPSLLPSTALPLCPPALLSRLDAATSGLVLAATSTAAAERFRILEAAGNVRKYYLAVVHGAITAPFAVRNALDTDNRKKTRVLAEDSPDMTRHSEVTPLGHARTFSIPGIPAETTLVAVTIKRGARHQIRAHMAYAGFPILGDALYGTSEDCSLYLHHSRLIFPDFHAFRLPLWLPHS